MKTSGILYSYAMHHGSKLFVIVQALDYQDATRILKLHGHNPAEYSLSLLSTWKACCSAN